MTIGRKKRSRKQLNKRRGTEIKTSKVRRLG